LPSTPKNRSAVSLVVQPGEFENFTEPRRHCALLPMPHQPETNRMRAEIGPGHPGNGLLLVSFFCVLWAGWATCGGSNAEGIKAFTCFFVRQPLGRY
jgi:hypothetical protein